MYFIIVYLIWGSVPPSGKWFPVEFFEQFFQKTKKKESHIVSLDGWKVWVCFFKVIKHRASVTTELAVTLQIIISMVFYVVFYECSRQSHSPSYLYYYLHNVAINISSVVLKEYNSFKFNTTTVITYGFVCFGADRSLMITESFRRKLELLVALPAFPYNNFFKTKTEIINCNVWFFL